MLEETEKKIIEKSWEHFLQFLEDETPESMSRWTIGYACQLRSSVLDLFKRNQINGEYYAIVLQRLSGEIRKKRPYLAKKEVLFYQDNAPVHTSVIAMVKINKCKLKLLPYAPYSPDLAPLDYFLFTNLKKWLGDQIFANNEEVESAVNGYFMELDGYHYK